MRVDAMSGDIIDRIDELVDEQLDNYRDRSGYDHNVGQDTCWHCGRHWHGLAITEAIDRMYQIGRYEPEYIHADDNSPVLCPGSEFIGPITADGLTYWERHPRWYDSGLNRIGNAQVRIVVDRTPWQRLAQRFEEMTRAIQGLILPEFDMSSWFTPPVREVREEVVFISPYVVTDGDLSGYVSIGNYERGRGPSITQLLYDEFRQERPCEPAPEIDWTPGPHNWGPHVRRDEPLQFPRQWGWQSLWGGTPPNPLQPLITEHWDEFTAPAIPMPEQPGFDFTAYATDVPDSHGPAQRRERR